MYATHTQLLISQLSCFISDTLVHFQDVTLSFKQKRYGIVGDNGVEKTTLLKLITGLLYPHQGNIQRRGRVVYFSQNLAADYTNATVADVFDISQQFQALTAITQKNTIVLLMMSGILKQE